MAVDRRQKHKRRRAQKRKTRLKEKAWEIQREKMEEYDFLIQEAYYNDDYQTALNLALKRLKKQPLDLWVLQMAIHSAKQLGYEQVLYDLLLMGWELDALRTREDYLLLAQMASHRKDTEIARSIYQDLLTDAFPIIRPLTKTQRKQVKHSLEWIDSLEHYQELNQELQERVQRAKQRSQTPPKKSTTPSTADQRPPKKSSEIIMLEPEIHFQFNIAPVLDAIQAAQSAQLSDFQLTLEAYKLSFRSSYEQLLCLPTLRHVKSLWYQEETARKIMKLFRGRAILADEVGLGKTIEAGLVLKEYILRGLVRSVLVLTPSSLVNQWYEELVGKFQLSFVTSNDALFREDPDRFWQSPYILASINTAKSRRNFDSVTSRTYDMVIVDEAHHLKNRSTLNWKLVNAIQKTFLLLLTATPVENKLEELYNLVTLLRPGHLKTRKSFLEEFVSRGNPTDPRNREKLRGLLKEVMLRNTRSVAKLNLPPRFAYTIKVSPNQSERAFYNAISNFIAQHGAEKNKTFNKQTLQHLLAAAGSSHLAALKMLTKIATNQQNDTVHSILKQGTDIKVSAKVEQVIELLTATPEQVIIFVRYIATLEYLKAVFTEYKLPCVVFQGSMNPDQKQEAVEAFRKGCPIFLSTATGGEGHNLQFCHTMINYDLPWNPMEIEQRIGRIHRIGQEKEVYIYNFCAADSLEDHILEVLDRKINMFELVIGEIDMILGRLKEEQEFSDIVYELWVQNLDESQRKKAFNSLAQRLKRARSAYEKSKELDEKLFQEDFGV